MFSETALTEPTTGDKIMSAAEALFFAKGYEAVSVREITEAAGANVAAVNYHFGGKKNLYREAVRRRLTRMAERKLNALDGVISRRGFDDLRAILQEYVEDFLGSLLSSKEEENFVNVMSREIAQESIAADLLFEELVYPVHTLLKDAILKARPEMLPEKASLCISSITGQILHFVRARVVIKRMTGREYDPAFLREIIDHITDFSLRGIGE